VQTTAIILYIVGGSPYAWRVRFALEHKRIAHQVHMLSFEAGELKQPQFTALNPPKKVPVLVDDDFVLYESAAIMECLDERWSVPPIIFATSARQRAVQQRMVRECDQYFAAAMERLSEHARAS
jgi:glutathione S-transferase